MMFCQSQLIDQEFHKWGSFVTSKAVVMINHSPISSPTFLFDAFLYAPVCDQRNGTQLTVISALARMDVDPWDEAARIAAMPKAAAEKEVISILRQASGTWTEGEVEFDSHAANSASPTGRWQWVGCPHRCCKSLCGPIIALVDLVRHCNNGVIDATARAAKTRRPNRGRI